MPDLDSILRRLAEHEGVEAVLLTGRDGLLVRRAGDGAVDAEAVAALLPEVAAACAGLARGAQRGELSSVVLELSAGVVVVVAVSRELLLALLVRPGVGFAPLLREARSQRSTLAALL